MRTIARAVMRPEAGGEALPPVFRQFEQRRIKIRRGEVTMIAGKPGAGKSLLALWHAKTWASKGLKGFYFSADSGEKVQGARLATQVGHGLTLEEAERRLEEGDPAMLRTLAQFSNLRWSFVRDISLEEIDLELQAFNELYGEDPDFVIVDTVTDIEGQAEDEWGALRRMMKTMSFVAGESGAAVVVLHHVSEDAREDPCPPRKAIHGKVSQKPSVILTVAKGDGRHKPVCCVKNRYGPDDGSGSDAIFLRWEPSRGAFLES